MLNKMLSLVVLMAGFMVGCSILQPANNTHEKASSAEFEQNALVKLLLSKDYFTLRELQPRLKPGMMINYYRRSSIHWNLNFQRTRNDFMKIKRVSQADQAAMSFSKSIDVMPSISEEQFYQTFYSRGKTFTHYRMLVQELEYEYFDKSHLIERVKNSHEIFSQGIRAHHQTYLGVYGVFLAKKIILEFATEPEGDGWRVFEREKLGKYSTFAFDVSSIGKNQMSIEGRIVFAIKALRFDQSLNPRQASHQEAQDIRNIIKGSEQYHLACSWLNNGLVSIEVDWLKENKNPAVMIVSEPYLTESEPVIKAIEQAESLFTAAALHYREAGIPTSFLVNRK